MVDVTVCIVGNSQTGKTSLAVRATLPHGTPFELCNSHYPPTKGIDHFTTILDLNSNQHRIHIWEFSKDENYTKLHNSIAQNAHIIVYCVDMSKTLAKQGSNRKEIEEDLKEWKRSFPNAKLILVGTKCDKCNDPNKEANENYLKTLARENSIPVMFDSSSEPNISAIDRLHQEFFSLGAEVKKAPKVESHPRQASMVTPREKDNPAAIPFKTPKEKKISYPSSYMKICDKVKAQDSKQKLSPEIKKEHNKALPSGNNPITYSPQTGRPNIELHRKQPANNSPISSPTVPRSNKKIAPNPDIEQNYYCALSLLQDYCKMDEDDFSKNSRAGKFLSSVRSYFWLAVTCHLGRNHVRAVRNFLINHERLAESNNNFRNVTCLLQRLQEWLANTGINLEKEKEGSLTKGSLRKRIKFIEETLLTPSDKEEPNTRRLYLG
ncbi:hypothetical protein ACQUW5_10565 [Legionella sp. CNM-1927-20]|uniref:hypothetical protein n=1 Tax=Legionella sp. CNM-1927-20 TaxID=3422221 RepID=UPI00403A8953